MPDGVTRFALSVYRRLPVGARRRIVRTISPNFTVGAMCFVERSDGALLLVQHTYRQRWGVPGGLLEKGEDARSAARREVFEETGIRIELLGEPAVVVDPEPQRVDLVFRAQPVAGTPLEPSGSSPEIRAVRWYPAGELPELQAETAQAMVTLARSSHTPQARPLSVDRRTEPFAS
jgi:ADP-ribose pyrophosphatase YjhB (NUDIX family)